MERTLVSPKAAMVAFEVFADKGVALAGSVKGKSHLVESLHLPCLLEVSDIKDRLRT
jgi:hypothetical protein